MGLIESLYWSSLFMYVIGTGISKSIKKYESMWGIVMIVFLIFVVISGGY